MKTPQLQYKARKNRRVTLLNCLFPNLPTTSEQFEYFEVCQVRKGVDNLSASTISNQNGNQYLTNALRANIVACRIQSSADDSEVISPFSELLIVTGSL
jgi:hypothetical protein